MKKTLVVLLAIILASFLFGCQSQEDKDKELINAIINRETSKISELIESGANVNSRYKHAGNYYNYSPLKVALYQDSYDTEIAKILIEHGADVNEINEENGNSLLHDVIELDVLRKFMLLINSGIDLNLQNNEGMTPLMLTAKYNKDSWHEQLVHNGANRSIKNNKGETEWDISKRTREEYAVSLRPKPPTIGMTAKEVRESTWGEPKKINKTTTKYGVSEQWVYSGYKYIYLGDGIVTAIQESN